MWLDVWIANLFLGFRAFHRILLSESVPLLSLVPVASLHEADNGAVQANPASVCPC